MKEVRVDTKITAGAVAGLIGGVIFALMAQLITTSTSSGDRISMLTTAAATVHSHWWLTGWVASLVYAVVIGGLFGWLLRTQTQTLNERPLMIWGGLYGVVWWLVSGLVVVPLLLGRVPLSPDAIAVMRPVVLASLAEHVVYGVILGFTFAWITKYVDRRRGGIYGATNSARRAA